MQLLETPAEFRARLQTSPEWKIIGGDQLEEKLGKMEPEAERINDEIQATRALLQVVSHMKQLFWSPGSKLLLLEVRDKHYQNGKLRGPAVNVLKKCEQLGLKPKVISQYYRHENEGEDNDNYKQCYQIEITFPWPPKAETKE